ncbi:MAG: ATP-binding protein [Acidobacteria bacterium]|nr:ATP-binding protein [Acidobacteriota bacterium]
MNSSDEIRELLCRAKMKDAASVLPALIEQAKGQRHSYTWLLTKLLEHELAARDQRAILNREQRARLPENWTLKSFPWERQPGVDRREILQLAELDFVSTGSNVVFIGEVGVGKTGLAIGLAREAVLAGYTVLFLKVCELLDLLGASLLDRSHPRLIRRLARLDLLVIDEFSHVTLEEQQASLIFRLIDVRYHRKATIFTTNLGFDDWGQFLKTPALKHSLTDRLTDQCYVVRIEGPSLRVGPRPSLTDHAKPTDAPVEKTTGQKRKKGQAASNSEAGRSPG